MDFRELITASGLALRNAAGTFATTFLSSATAARTITYPDKDGTVALTNDLVSPGAWTSWTPTITGLTLGNGTIVCAYKYLTDKTVAIRFQLTFGSTTVITSGPVSITLPANTNLVTGLPVGNIAIIDTSSGNTFEGRIIVGSSATLNLTLTYAISSYCYTGGITTTSPVALTTGDQILGTGQYERN